MSDFVSKTFTDFKSAEEAVTLFCQTNFHPVHVDSKESCVELCTKFCCYYGASSGV